MKKFLQVILKYQKSMSTICFDEYMIEIQIVDEIR